MEIIDQPYMSLEEWDEFIKEASIPAILEEWETLPDEISTKYFLKLTHAQQADFLIHLQTSEQEKLILNLANQNIEELLHDIEPDDLVDLFQKVSQEVRDTVWKNLSEESQQITNFLLRFDYDDAAGIMTPKYMKVRPNISVGQTIKLLRKNVDEVESIYYIYIVDAINRLQGVVSIRDLFRKKDEVKLSEFMETKIYTVDPDTDQEEVVDLLKEHDLLAVPVVDKFNQLLGIVTIDDAMQVLSEEHQEDVLQMGGISTNTNTHPLSYLENSILSLFRSRVPWLAILLFAGTLTSNVINAFTNLIYYAPYLILFIPAITSTGGNTATQSATLMIHGLARNDFSFSHLFKILYKETIIAFMIGVSLASVMLLRGIILPPSLSISEAVIISASLVFVVFFSALIGCFTPLLISRLGADPTVIATPLIATIIDLLGLSIYFLMTYLFILH